MQELYILVGAVLLSPILNAAVSPVIYSVQQRQSDLTRLLQKQWELVTYNDLRELSTKVEKLYKHNFPSETTSCEQPVNPR